MRGELVEVDADKGGLVACTLYARAGTIHDHVYVHAKIGIVDDRWLTLGSANLNEHSLLNDIEMNFVTHGPGLVTQTRGAYGQNTSSFPLDQLPADPTEAVDWYWKPISAEQLACRKPTATHPQARTPPEHLKTIRTPARFFSTVSWSTANHSIGLRLRWKGSGAADHSVVLEVEVDREIPLLPRVD